MAQQSQKYIHDIYNKIKHEKCMYGSYKKALFHLHTPASHDYKMIESWPDKKYKNCNDSDLIELCYERKLIPESFNLYDYSLDDERKKLFKDKKEWLSYLMIAGTLMENDYEIVVVTDHNTLDGLEKIKWAVEDYYKSIYKGVSGKRTPSILNGVEVSCADRFHVVGVFPDDKIDQIKSWIDDNILSTTEGSFRTSFDTIKVFEEQGGFAYIAHILSSEFFNNNLGNGAYKKKLIRSHCFDLVGIRSVDKLDRLTSLMENHNISDYGVLIDNDSHGIDTINRNYFWIKTGTCNFDAVLEALDNYGVSVLIENNKEPDQYIYGVVIEHEEGFLSGKKEGSPFSMRFSPSLNCFIGGRGTGKSTVLDVLSYALGQKVENEHELDYICKHGNIWVLYVYRDKEYLINVSLPRKEHEGEHILRYFGQNPAAQYYYKYTFDKDEIKKYIVNKHVDIYEVDTLSSDISFSHVQRKNIVLSTLFDTHYSVNKLVEIAGNESIGRFIYDLMFGDKGLDKLGNEVKVRSLAGLKKFLKKIEERLKERHDDIHRVIDPYNSSVNGIIRIDYSQDGALPDPDFSTIMFNTRNLDSGNYHNYPIKKELVVEYLYYVFQNESLFSFFKLVSDCKSESRYKYPIHDFLNTTNGDIDEKTIIDFIFNDLFSPSRLDKILRYIKESLNQMESFQLQFNVNSSSASMKGSDYRNINSLSLGQKVVAMMDFIIGYGTYIGDHRPLIIDQPEDNLDNQYIYNNLVKELRKVKQERQVIIATHNATIVTNSMTDQVCVMNSDNIHGWIEDIGYPSEEKIKKAIVNYLEGGIESFNHKAKIYKKVINNNL